MPSIEFLIDQAESFSSLEDECDDDQEDGYGSIYNLSNSEESIPKPICLKKEEWLSERIKKCTIISNFKTDPIDDIEEKMEYLEDLSEYFVRNPGPMSRQRYAELFEMFSTNLFRKIPQNKKRNYDPEDEVHTLEEGWPHLKLVYDIFRMFLEMSALRLDYTKIYMTDKFLHEFLELMDSDDPREKEMTKKVVHRIYLRFRTSRAYLRKELTNILLKFIYETEYFSGVTEILEIYSCIIDGLSRPISEEFVVFLSKVLVPLHKVKNLSVFHHYLKTCLINYLGKDTSVFKTIIEGLIKYWPKTNSLKEVLFLNEVEELLDAVDVEGFTRVHLQLFGQISKCVLSSHFQVVERSLSIFNSQSAYVFIDMYYTELLPVLLPSLLQRRKGHWNQTVSVHVYNVLKKLKAIDEDFYNRTVREVMYPPPVSARAGAQKRVRIADKEVTDFYFEDDEENSIGSQDDDTSFDSSMYDRGDENNL